MDLAELMDISPFDGWTLTNRSEDEGALAPVLTPSGPVAVERLSGVLTLLRHGEPFFTTDVMGRITELVLTEEQVACTLPAKLAGGARLRVRSNRKVLLCRQAGHDLTPGLADGWIEITLAATGEHPEPFRLLLA
jgi:hypothetical protein